MNLDRWAAWRDLVEIGGRACRGAMTGARAPLVWLAVLCAIACGGSAFSTESASGGTGAGGQAKAGGGNAQAGTQSSEGGGGVSSDGGVSADGGTHAAAGAGASSAEAGSGGAATALTCPELLGISYAEHCYVEVTAESVNQLDAVAACADLALRAGRPAHVLVLGSEEEQSFIIKTFLSEVSDAWLALTCSSTEHPELTDCYCVECEDGLLLQKRAVWSWADGSSATFGWSGNNPDGALRCAALAYNPSIAQWGWVDRSCLSTSHQIQDLPRHSYRAICELP